MRLARVLLIALSTIALVGCLSEGSRARWLNSVPLLRPTTDPDTALVQYVIVERTAGTDEINRRVWDRVDEQVVPYETRSLLEEAGLRVGTTSDSAPGALRKLIDDPRTSWGHRVRTLALDRPGSLVLTTLLPHAEFAIPTADGGRTNFARDQVALSFDLHIKPGEDGRVLVKLVPRAKYHDATQVLTAEVGERGLSSETFPAAGVEIALSPSEYLVVGTDYYWEGTFGHAALMGDTDERRVQRLMVLKAAVSQGDRPSPLGGDKQATTPPLASQASAIRGARP
jgi:uncharacterized protein YceK